VRVAEALTQRGLSWLSFAKGLEVGDLLGGVWLVRVLLLWLELPLREDGEASRDAGENAAKGVVVPVVPVYSGRFC